MAFLTVNFMSKSLMRTVTMNVILPADKLEADGDAKKEIAPFKTLYLLHGVLGSYTDWVNGTNIQRWAEEKNLAVVMPSGENSFYVDHEGGAGNYGEFIGQELIEVTRKMFHLSHKREDTFLAGLSMGGYGAIRNGLKYHENFGYVAGLSSAVLVDRLKLCTDDSSIFFERRSFLEQVFGDLNKVENSDKNPSWLIKKLSEEHAAFPKLYMACGTEDPLLEPNRKLKADMLKSGVDLIYEEGPGGHNWDFWNTYIKKVLNWLPLDVNEKAGINSGNVGV